MQITVTRQINAPIDKVFNVFSDLGKVEDRITGISKIEMLEGDEKMAVGTKWVETREMFGQTATETMWVTDLQANRSYVVEAESRGVKYKSTYEFESNDQGTEVIMTFEGTPVTLSAKIMGALTTPFFKGASQKALEVDMDELKEVCEQGA